MKTAPPPTPLPRANALDFFLVLLGFALSQFLATLPAVSWDLGPAAPMRVVPRLLMTLPTLLRLPEGVVLLWPVFLTLQRIRGRTEGLTVGEWLWVFAWLGTAVMVLLGLWKDVGFIPERLAPYAAWPTVVWYALVVPSMALVALLLLLIGLASERERPWTHAFGLVLLLWPAVPLGAMAACVRLGWATVPRAL